MARSLLLALVAVGSSASAQTPTSPIVAVVIHPPVAAPFQCSEHALGAEGHAGDALGADCVVVRMGGGPGGGPFATLHAGDGARNEDWHSWDEPLLAPFDGVVVDVHLNPLTNAPGTPGEGTASYVLFRRLGDDPSGAPVHVGYVHVQDVLVAAGDTVRAGEPVARIGNDGRSWHPHVHVGAFRGELTAPDAVPLQVRMDLAALGRLRGIAPHPKAGSTVAARLAGVPPERALSDGRLRVVNVYRAQALAVAETAGQAADSTVERLVRDAYRPYAAFWAGYLGDEARFRAWAGEALLGPGSPIDARLDSVLALDLDGLFESGAAWVEAETGRAPEGTWYLAFGPGWTDMGGIGGSTMVADLSELGLDPARLPHTVAHELVHQVHGPSPARADDPDRGTVLDRIVSEGLGSYAAFVHAGRRAPADAVGYSEGAWRWALDHEAELAAAAVPTLASRDRADLDRVASRGESLLDPGVGAPGYFLGFRVVEAYEATHGPGSWAEIVDLPVREALARSGYPLLTPSAPRP